VSRALGTAADPGDGWEWGDDLPPFGALVAGLADVGSDRLGEGADDTELEMAELEEIVLTLAIELEVRDAEQLGPRVTGATPTQWTETTVLPVFHRLSLHITKMDDA
jgi:hypothetical protein